MQMRLDNFFYSGFEFKEDEDLLKFKFKMINTILVIVIFFSTLFGLLHDLGINDIGEIHSKVDYFYSLSSALIVLFLRKSKTNYLKSAHILFIVSIITFTSALMFVPQDEFRIIWFYLLVLIAYMLTDSKSGMFYTFLSLAIILTVNYFVDLQISEVSMNSAILGLIVGSLLSRAYSNKTKDYENMLNERNKSLHILATTDGLTGIMNRRYFDEVTHNYFETVQRYNNDISLLMMDLDHFKEVNDTYGHDIGDKYLIAFVDKVKSMLRKSDLFARVGGEEFAILLFNTNHEEALKFAEKICNEVRDVEITYKDKIISITVSIGISQNRKTDKTFKKIYIRSDDALYQAKEEGRDRVCVVL